MFRMIILGIIIYYFYNKYIRDTRRREDQFKNESTRQLSNESKDRTAYYKSRGLTDKDINYFRETMTKAKDQIVAIESNLNQNRQLKDIAVRHSTARLTQALFKDIVNEPERLSEVDQFLYVHLPSLDEITRNYVQISKHKARSIRTDEILISSLETIEQLCDTITDDYLNFREKDINELSIGVELAKRRLDK